MIFFSVFTFCHFRSNFPFGTEIWKNIKRMNALSKRDKQISYWRQHANQWRRCHRHCCKPLFLLWSWTLPKELFTFLPFGPPFARGLARYPFIYLFLIQSLPTEYTQNSTCSAVPLPLYASLRHRSRVRLVRPFGGRQLHRLNSWNVGSAAAALLQKRVFSERR